MILSIETATSVCSIAVHNKGELIVNAHLHLEKSHSSSLVLLIQQMLKHADLSTKDLQAVAVSEGPGSYTGLRIGVSTAKGICFANDIPLIAISTLQAMANQVLTYHQKTELLFAPMLDARRMEVYTALYDAKLSVIQKPIPLIVDEKGIEFFENYNNVLLFGNGSPKAKEILASLDNIHFIDDIFPSAIAMGNIAFDKYIKGQFENLAYFEPFYLKEFFSPKPKKKNLL